MEVAVQVGTVAAHDRKAAERIASERVRARSRRDRPASSGDWAREMAAGLASAAGRVPGMIAKRADVDPIQ